jgi:N-methylhydantoinase A
MAKPARTVGVDTGGTFTDLVSLEAGKLRFEKVPSTPAAPERAILDGLARLAVAPHDARGELHVVHGTTVALNALLTGRVARTALVTNEGFADLIEIGRQDRPELYALHPRKIAPLVPRERRFEIGQRSWPDPNDPRGGCVEVRAPSRAELARLRRELEHARPEAIAICLLHSYADPRPEERVAKALRSLGVPLTTSAGLLREHREFERFSTAVVNAALTPLVRGYLQRLEGALGAARLSLLRSSGGRISAARAADEPVRVLLSGPAGGVLGAARAAREAGFDSMVGLDIGGTSADVAFRRTRGRAGEPVRASVVAGHPIGVPALDIHTLGCGGGSLLRVDNGVLRVGPQSAGADPGPVCYGRGEEPTLTDAHLLLGRIAPGEFLGGRLALDLDAVERAFEELARRLGVKPREAALAALDVANAAMRRALGVMTMQRGEDPLHTPLVAFGGAGGLHAADLARSMEMPCAIVPQGPGVLSALGMATADAVAERSRSVLANVTRLERSPQSQRELEAVLAALAQSAREELLEDVDRRAAIEIERFYELRYEGQSFELRLAPSASLAATVRAFHRKHAALYGYALTGSEVELVNVAVRATARSGAKRLAGAAVRASSAPSSSRRVWFASSSGAPRALRAAVHRRDALRLGQRVAGPAVLEEFSGASLVPPGWSARVVRGGHVVLAAD